MAVEINGKVYRNLPEQVKKNQEDIESLEASVIKEEIVDVLPETGEANKIYLVDNGEGYTQYIWDPEAEIFKLIGNNLLNIENGSATGAIKTITDSENWTFSNPNSTRNNETITTGATGQYSSALGGKSKSEGKRAVAEGTQTIAQGNYSHAEGNNSISVGSASHAEGLQCVASGAQSHAEGNNTIAYGNCSHAEGEGTRASGYCSIATGLNSYVSAGYASAHGMGSRAVQFGQFVVGKYNQEQGDAMFIVGDGTSDEAADRHNAFSVHSSGGVSSIKIGGTVLTEAQLIALLNLL